MLVQSIDLVQEFHAVYKHPVADYPQFPADKDNSFRANFMKEETGETVEAIAAKDFPKFLDGLCDLQYVLDGWFLNAGVTAELKDLLMQEVHRSNMSKLCKTRLEALQTCSRIKAETGQSCIVDDAPSGFVVKRVADGKVMKGPHFFEPNLEAIYVNFLPF